MFLRARLYLTCVAVSTACLVSGFGLARLWILLSLGLITTIAWVLAWKLPANWLPAACLAGTVGLAATGLLSQAAPVLMVLASSAGLAGWDLLLQDRSLHGHNPAGGTAGFESTHLRSLALAFGLGLSVALAGLFVHLEIPFILMVALVILVVFSLNRIVHLLEADRAK